MPVRVGLHDSSIVNLERGVLERIFYCKDDGVHFAPPTQPTVDLFWGRLLPFRRRLIKRTPTTTCMTHQEFIDSYVGRKREIYRKAVESLKADAVNRRDSHLKTFVKAEKLNISVKPDPAPRVIQPRDPRYNVEVGKYLKRMEHHVYKGIDQVFGYVTVTKGMNMNQVASLIVEHWGEFNDPVAIMADANRFDQHVHESALRWEHSVYLSAVEPDERAELGRLLSWQIRNIAGGRCPDGFISYKKRGSRMSGDMNTAMGNVLLMCAMVWAYVRDRQVKIRLVNNGDDSVFIMERKDLARFVNGLDQWFLEMGFSMAVSAPVTSVHEIKFCQACPLDTGAGWTMVRDPRIALAKDAHSLISWDSEATYRRWCASISDCGEAIAGDLPVFCAFYAMMKRAAGGRPAMGHHPGLEGGLWFEAKRMGDERRYFAEPSVQSRVSFWESYDISPAEQIAMEHYFETLTPEWGPEDAVVSPPTDDAYLKSCELGLSEM
jgi:hypothetical protein